eukprot:scaffold671746_cov48-Prasinocladus_malaysianus.AAC.1
MAAGGPLVALAGVTLVFPAPFIATLATEAGCGTVMVLLGHSTCKGKPALRLISPKRVLADAIEC